MNIHDYLNDANLTQVEFARSLGVAQGTVGFWLHNKPPTIERCIQIEKLTGGKVRCEDLRPDVDWAYLRGTAPSEDADRVPDFEEQGTDVPKVQDVSSCPFGDEADASTMEAA